MGRAGKVGAGAASGALAGAAAGSVVPGIGTAIGAAGGAIVGGVGGWLSADEDDANDERRAQLDQLRINAKQSQIDQINAMKGPSLTPQMEARLKALEAQSVDRPLIEDPYFQGQRATITQGGRSAISDIQNRQRALKAGGGFSNVGSMNDVYDRVGGQLAQLGGQAMALRDQKSQTAAEARQGIADAQTAFENSKHQYFAALQAGDYQAMAGALQNYMDAKTAIDQRQSAFNASMLNTGLNIGARGLMSQKAPAAEQPFIAPPDITEQPGIPLAKSYNMTEMTQPQTDYSSLAAGQPWAVQRKQYGL